eukprot:1702961-Pyramimonas_sp.AAC.1
MCALPVLAVPGNPRVAPEGAKRTPRRPERTQSLPKTDSRQPTMHSSGLRHCPRLFRCSQDCPKVRGPHKDPQEGPEGAEPSSFFRSLHDFELLALPSFRAPGRPNRPPRLYRDRPGGPHEAPKTAQ